MDYNITLTYLLWLFFGWLGIHHLYLGRLNHAIIWFATGGCLVIGWIQDLWRIPSYVAWATADDTNQLTHMIRMELQPQPPCSFFKSVGMIVMGFLAAEVFSNIIPSSTGDDWLAYPLYYIFCSFSSKYLYLFGGVTGIYLVCNIGHTECDLEDLLMGCFYSLPFVIFNGVNAHRAVLFIGLKARFWDLKWKQQPFINEMNMSRAMYNSFPYCLATVIWLSLICISLYLKDAIDVDENEDWPRSDTKLWHILLRGITIINISGNGSLVGKLSLELGSEDSQLTSDNIWLTFKETIDSFLDGLDL